MKTNDIYISKYDPNWPNAFLAIKKELLNVLDNQVLAIEHVGSTAVYNLPAKPIIDIDIVIDGNFNEVKSRLEQNDYIYEGELGIKGRHAFKYTNKPKLMKHHLYVCNKESTELKRHLVFRDYLRKNPEKAKAYGKLKERLAIKWSNNSEAYTKGKSEFINTIYKKYGI